MSVEVTRFLYNTTLTSDSLAPTSPKTKGVRLPKLEIPTFEGDILYWLTFWEQFYIAIDGRKDISDTEKLVYHRLLSRMVLPSQSLKDYPTLRINTRKLLGLRSQDTIVLASSTRLMWRSVKYPISRKDQGENWGVYMTHLCALKSMGQEADGPFITSTLELKFDKETMFEWQKASQDSLETPHFEKLLDFIDLRAQASETCNSEQKYLSRSIASFSANVSEPNCTFCKTEKHPLYSCTHLKLLPHDKMLATVRSNNLC